MYKTHNEHLELDQTPPDAALVWATNKIMELSEENDRLKERLKRHGQSTGPAVHARKAA